MPRCGVHESWHEMMLQVGRHRGCIRSLKVRAHKSASQLKRRQNILMVYARYRPITLERRIGHVARPLQQSHSHNSIGNKCREDTSFLVSRHATAEKFYQGQSSLQNVESPRMTSDVEFKYGRDGNSLSAKLAKILIIYEGQKVGMYNDIHTNKKSRFSTKDDSDEHSISYLQKTLKEGSVRMEGMVPANTITSVLTTCRKEKRHDVAKLFWEDLMKNDGISNMFEDQDERGEKMPLVIVNHIHYSIYAIVLGANSQKLELRRLFAKMMDKVAQNVFIPDSGTFEAFIKAGGYADEMQISHDAFEEVRL